MPAGDEYACAKTQRGITSPANQDLRAIRIPLLFVWPRFWGSSAGNDFGGPLAGGSHLLKLAGIVSAGWQRQAERDAVSRRPGISFRNPEFASLRIVCHSSV